MDKRLEDVLESKWLWLTARVLMVVVFASAGAAKLIDFDGGMAEMRLAGLEPAWIYNIIVATGLLAGSLLILLDRWMWLAAGGLAAFLGLTILVVHHFWSLPAPQANISMFFALEHLSLIGGLLAIAIASHARRSWLTTLERWNQ